MADVHNKTTRSYNMSQIKSKDTKPELLVRKYLHSKGFRFRLNEKKLPGKPDIVLPKYKTVIFVNGCFWHGHKGCKYFVMPKSRIEYWSSKIKRNQLNDSKAIKLLMKDGWKVITVFECELKKAYKEKTLQKIATAVSYL